MKSPFTMHMSESSQRRCPSFTLVAAGLRVAVVSGAAAADGAVIDDVAVGVVATVARRAALAVLAALVGRTLVVALTADHGRVIGLRHALDERTADVARRAAADGAVVAHLAARVRGARAAYIARTLAAAVDTGQVEVALAVGDAARSHHRRLSSRRLCERTSPVSKHTRKMSCYRRLVVKNLV